ncbi:MAG: hypothetical protein Q7R35_19270 [Elusimicrobiota bacterium]|nr:hypothetical protein [Elusimicrobiota bacterium]
MSDNFDESSLNEAAINDVETARLALRWALDKIRALHEDDVKIRQNLQDKSSQVSFLENQLKTKNVEIDRSARVHEEEMKSRQSSLEYQFHSRLERMTEREKELEDKISKNDEALKQKESRLQEDYQKKAEELRGRWAQVEGELWQLRQEQLAKQQEFERVYGARLEEEKKRFADEAAVQKDTLEATYRNRVEELEKREHSVKDEMKKQEAVLKWAKDSWLKDTEERERALKLKDLEIDKKILEKNQEIDDYKVQVSLLDKQLREFPAAMKRRDEDLNRYKDAIGSLESVIRTLETEKKNQQADYELRLSKAGDAVETERNRFREMESEIPKRLKIAVEHERNRFAEKLQEIEHGYRDDLGKRQDEVEYLQRNLRTFEETIKTLQAERESFSHKVEQMQTQYSVKLEEFAFREKQLQSEYDVRLKVEMEKHTAALRAEIETAGRIYEDSLRLKVEEISHLRRDIDELSKEKAAGKEQQVALRREIETIDGRAAAEQTALRAKLKSEFDQKLADEAVHAEKRHSAEKQKFVDELEGRSAEFLAEVGRKDEDISALRLAIQKAGEELRMLRQKAGEELKAAVAEERARAAAELDDRSSRLAGTIRLRDEKITELAAALDASKIAKEELVLLERERLQRLYTEKEKVLDEELAGRDAELLRVREALAKAAADKDGLSVGYAAERRALEEKIEVLTVRLSDEEAAGGVKLDAALRREADRYGEIIERKNRELEAATQLRQSQDDAYRKTLEDFRSNLGDSLSKIENFKRTAEERQVQLYALQAELAQEKKQAADQSASLSSKLSEKEKLHRDLRVEYEDFKEAFEEEVKAGERKYNDSLLKLRGAEEQKAARDKQIEGLKRDNELLRGENLRREHEAAELKAASAKQMENERREIHSTGERRAHEYAQKEKALLVEISSLRDIANSNELQVEKQTVQFEEARNRAERLKAMLEEERARQVENDAAQRAGLERVKAAFEEEKKKRAEIEAAALTTSSALREKTAEFAGQRSELETLIRGVERLKISFEEERKKRAEAEAAAENSSLALREKSEESLEHRSETEALRHAVERLKAALDDERKKRSEAEEAAKNYSLSVREKTEETVGHRAETEALRHAVERLKAAFADERKKRVEAELLAETSHSALREKADQLSGQKSEVDSLKNAVERLKAALEEEKRKRSEIELSASTSRSALNEKAEEISGRASEIEALKHGIERLKHAFEEERGKRVESELLAETAHSALREKQEEFIYTQKLVEQLKDKLRLWKSK